MVKLVSASAAFSLILLSVGLLSSNSLEADKATFSESPKRVILLLAEGMGLQQITAGIYSKSQKLNLEKFKFIGFHKNSSANHLTAETGAASTAIACGIKTPDGCLAIDAKGEMVKTILEEVQENDFSTGIVTNAALTDPGPAAFYAHVKDERQHEEIAMYLADRNVDFLVGGGKKYFTNRTTDNRNLYKEMQESGYVVSDYEQQQFGKGSLDLQNDYCFFTAEEQPENQKEAWSNLYNASKLALNFLKSHNDNGNFFLLIENREIEIGSKENNTTKVVEEVLHMDNLIGTLLEFVEKDKETLLIVTGDHETGGFAINPGSTPDSLMGAFLSSKYTGTMMPVFAYGPGSEYFTGVYDNVDINQKLKTVLDVK